MLNWFIVIFRFTISFSCCSVAQLRLTLCDPMDCSTPGLPVPRHLPEFAQVRIHCISDAIQPSHPLTPSSPSALSFSQHRELFQWAVYITWPKSWSFSFSISSSSEYSGLISLKIDWFDLLALQGTFRSPLQHHSLKGISSLEFCLLYRSNSHDRVWSLGRLYILTISFYYSVYSFC